MHTAKTPVVDALRANAERWRTVKAHGPAVGLPTWDDMGNSEVGHNALGAGQLIDQGARLVDKALSTGTLFQNDGWKYISGAFEKHTVHFIGLLSSGGVHSRQDQLEHRARPLFYAPRPAPPSTAHHPRKPPPLSPCCARAPCSAVIRGCLKSGAKRVRVHILLDGRDVPDGSSVADVARLEKARAPPLRFFHALPACRPAPSRAAPYTLRYFTPPPHSFARLRRCHPLGRASSQAWLAPGLRRPPFCIPFRPPPRCWRSAVRAAWTPASRPAAGACT